MAKEQVSSILRALEILECFMDNETEWTLKRLVAQLDHNTPCLNYVIISFSTLYNFIIRKHKIQII